MKFTYSSDFTTADGYTQSSMEIIHERIYITLSRAEDIKKVCIRFPTEMSLDQTHTGHRYTRIGGMQFHPNTYTDILNNFFVPGFVSNEHVLNLSDTVFTVRGHTLEICFTNLTHETLPVRYLIPRNDIHQIEGSNRQIAVNNGIKINFATRKEYEIALTFLVDLFSVEDLIGF